MNWEDQTKYVQRHRYLAIILDKFSFVFPCVRKLNHNEYFTLEDGYFVWSFLEFFFCLSTEFESGFNKQQNKNKAKNCCREKASVTMAIFSYYGNLSINLAFICLFEVVFIETEHHDNQIDLKNIPQEVRENTNALARVVITSSLVALSIACIQVSWKNASSCLVTTMTRY